MTGELAAQIPLNTTLRTTEVAQPFKVRLEGVPAGDGDVVTVRDHVVIDGQSIVRAEVGKGFWHVAASTLPGTSILTAVFEPHETVQFSFPRRSLNHWRTG